MKPLCASCFVEYSLSFFCISLAAAIIAQNDSSAIFSDFRTNFRGVNDGKHKYSENDNLSSHCVMDKQIHSDFKFVDKNFFHNATSIEKPAVLPVLLTLSTTCDSRLLFEESRKDCDFWAAFSEAFENECAEFWTTANTLQLQLLCVNNDYHKEAPRATHVKNNLSSVEYSCSDLALDRPAFSRCRCDNAVEKIKKTFDDKKYGHFLSHLFKNVCSRSLTNDYCLVTVVEQIKTLQASSQRTETISDLKVPFECLENLSAVSNYILRSKIAYLQYRSFIFKDSFLPDTEIPWNTHSNNTCHVPSAKLPEHAVEDFSYLIYLSFPNQHKTNLQLLSRTVFVQLLLFLIENSFDSSKTVLLSLITGYSTTYENQSRALNLPISWECSSFVSSEIEKNKIHDICEDDFQSRMRTNCDVDVREWCKYTAHARGKESMGSNNGSYDRFQSDFGANYLVSKIIDKKFKYVVCAPGYTLYARSKAAIKDPETYRIYCVEDQPCARPSFVCLADCPRQDNSEYSTSPNFTHGAIRLIKCESASKDFGTVKVTTDDVSNGMIVHFHDQFNFITHFDLLIGHEVCFDGQWTTFPSGCKKKSFSKANPADVKAFSALSVTSWGMKTASFCSFLIVCIIGACILLFQNIIEIRKLRKKQRCKSPRRLSPSTETQSEQLSQPLTPVKNDYVSCRNAYFKPCPEEKKLPPQQQEEINEREVPQSDEPMVRPNISVSQPPNSTETSINEEVPIGFLQELYDESAIYCYSNSFGEYSNFRKVYSSHTLGFKNSDEYSSTDFQSTRCTEDSIHISVVCFDGVSTPIEGATKAQSMFDSHILNSPSKIPSYMWREGDTCVTQCAEYKASDHSAAHNGKTALSPPQDSGVLHRETTLSPPQLSPFIGFQMALETFRYQKQRQSKFL